MSENSENHIGSLDGLRGLMAFWVFYGHLKILCVQATPRIGHPANAVDVFMFLSGFLMAYHWIARQSTFASTKAQVADFYVRRFFRIAPLYYVLLFVALFWQDSFFAANEHIKRTLHIPETTVAGASGTSTYADPSNRALSWENILSHFSFLFGFFPQYVSNNILPDWSIGLEMQFYAAFPFLIVAIRRLGRFSLIFIAIGAVWFTNNLFSLYSEPPKILGNFPQPGFLLFKLHIFIGGMFIAHFYRAWPQKRGVEWLLLGLLCLCWKSSFVFVGIVLTVLYFLCFDGLKSESLHKLLSGRVATFLGDTSYSVYLLHTLFLYPILAFLSGFVWFTNASPNTKVLICFFSVATPLYAVSFLTYRYIEIPGIRLGRKATRRILKTNLKQANPLEQNVETPNTPAKTPLSPGAPNAVERS